MAEHRQNIALWTSSYYSAGKSDKYTTPPICDFVYIYIHFGKIMVLGNKISPDEE